MCIVTKQATKHLQKRSPALHILSEPLSSVVAGQREREGAAYLLLLDLVSLGVLPERAGVSVPL